MLATLVDSTCEAKSPDEAPEVPSAAVSDLCFFTCRLLALVSAVFCRVDFVCCFSGVRVALRFLPAAIGPLGSSFLYPPGWVWVSLWRLRLLRCLLASSLLFQCEAALSLSPLAF